MATTGIGDPNPSHPPQCPAKARAGASLDRVGRAQHHARCCPDSPAFMKLLYLSLEAPLDIQEVATGNQVRAAGIREVLQEAGHVIDHLRPAPTGTTGEELPAGCYDSAEGLEAIIRDGQYDALFVGYWSLLAHLPGKHQLPVICDFIAPRLLELMFQDPSLIPGRARELIGLLARADLFLVGNRRQSDLLLPLLLQAGFDCRHQAPIAIVPISVRGKVTPVAPAAAPLCLVNAGVDWPWRQAAAYRASLERLCGQHDNLVFREFRGSYPGDDSGKDGKGASTLLSYADMQAALGQGHIGLEVGERNTEREFSHSFRAMEYLECGLPVIINGWIPLAETIRQYDAGWVVDDPQALEALVLSLLADPGQVARKREGARRLVTTELNYRHSCAPLLAFLEQPRRAQRIAGVKADAPVAGEVPALNAFTPRAGETRASTFKVILGMVVRALFFSRRPANTPDILMVTRSDLFPTDHGAAVKIIRTAESLSRQDRDVWLTTDDRTTYYQFSDGDMITHRFPLLVRLLCLPRLVAFIRLLLKGYPASNGFLYLPVTDYGFIIRTLYLSGRKPVGAYQAEFPAYVRPCRFARSLFGGKILLVQHNVEYERIRHQVPDLTAKNFHTLRNLEVAMCHLADNIVAVSDNDRDRMIRDGIAAEKIHTIPHGVDLHAFRETPPLNIRAHFGLPVNDPVIVYHGTFSYPPNLQAIEVMAREILPRLEARNLSVSVLAIGSKPPDFQLHPKVHFAGSILDLAEVIPAADLAVVPLLDGGGTRMKILDYFAAGVPVISTAKGIEGIPVENGREALIVDEYDAICDAIEQVLSDPALADGLRDAAGRFVDGLGWDAVVRGYLPLLQ